MAIDTIFTRDQIFKRNETNEITNQTMRIFITNVPRLLAESVHLVLNDRLFAKFSMHPVTCLRQDSLK